MDFEHRLNCKIIEKQDLTPATKAGITPDFFLDIMHKQVFRYILDYKKEYGSTPTLTVVKADHPEYKWIKVDEPYADLISRIVEQYAMALVNDSLGELSGAYHAGDLAEIKRVTAAMVTNLDNISDGSTGRHLVLTPASQIKMRTVKWAWQDRMPLGSLGVLAGREGLGKSTLAYSLAARITRGDLPGHFAGTPRGVLVVAAEDSWEHTIIPRLVAAGADLDRVFRVEMRTERDVLTGLDLPQDNDDLESTAVETEAALILLDPLLSRLSGKLDTHKDADVRQALEPLAAIADRTGTLILGIMHFNKTSTDDPLTAVMGSRALTAVPRSVSVIVRDPDSDEGMLAFSTVKNNLGRLGPSLLLKIKSCPVITEEGETYVGGIEWCGETERTAADMLSDAKDKKGCRTDAAEFLQAHLADAGGAALASHIAKAAAALGIALSTLQRAADQIGVQKVRGPRGIWTWSLEVETTSQSGPHS